LHPHEDPVAKLRALRRATGGTFHTTTCSTSKAEFTRDATGASWAKRTPPTIPAGIFSSA
jgi:hypothetical protein